MTNRFYGDTSHYDMALQCREDEWRRLAAVFGGKTVCLVAQGESVMKVRRGGFVDDHDIIVRMNNFKLAGYESYIGSRTDVHAFTNHSALHSDESCAARWFYCADGFLLRERLNLPMNEGNLLFWDRPAGDYDEVLRGKWPTTGLRILLDVLAAGAKEVMLLGYDFYQNSCYYFAPVLPGEKPLSDGLLDWQPDSTHDPLAEKAYVKELMKRDTRIFKL